jgi:hypothetical protein
VCGSFRNSFGFSISLAREARICCFTGQHVSMSAFENVPWSLTREVRSYFTGDWPVKLGFATSQAKPSLIRARLWARDNLNLSAESNSTGHFSF